MPSICSPSKFLKLTSNIQTGNMPSTLRPKKSLYQPTKVVLYLIDVCVCFAAHFRSFVSILSIYSHLQLAKSSINTKHSYIDANMTKLESM